MKKVLSGAFTVVVLAIFLFLLFVVLTRAQSEIVASGGPFALEKTSMAGGGNEKQMLGMEEHGTAGQAIAGSSSSGGAYSIYSGFWTPDSFAPTAANVMVRGRVTDQTGNGLRNVVVTITPPSGDVRTTMTNSFGFYTFDEVIVGETYLVSVYSKRYTFAEPSRVVHVAEEVTDANFVSSPDEF